VENVGGSAAQVSNHLGRLRDAGLLATQDEEPRSSLDQRGDRRLAVLADGCR
jgi:DNA-binding transcriptional ArsR family regulator